MIWINKESEVWAFIDGFSGKYQISTKGRVKSLSRVYLDKNGLEKKVKEKMLKQYVSSTGYWNIRLAKKNYKIHRLIAIAFIPNVNNKPFINHINHNKLDNNISNLEWCTNRENIVAAKLAGRMGRLTKDQIILIRDMYNYSERHKNHYRKKAFSQGYIARIFKTSQEHISNVVNDRIWKESKYYPEGLVRDTQKENK